jgi:hypothetical protein
MAAARDRLLALTRRAPTLLLIAAGCLGATGGVACVVQIDAAGALAAPASKRASTPTAQALLRSRELWATIDVCNSPKQPDTVGVRGSMPGDGKPADKLYMNFTLEYLNAVNQWTALPSSGSGWVLVGAGSSSSRQSGWSFTLKPPHSRGRLVLRGMVGFRWMRAGHQFAHTTLATTGGRSALAGSEPEGFSAARCTL